MRISKTGLAKFTLYAYFAFSPLYFFPSGTPQPADFILACLLFPWVLSSTSKLPASMRFMLKPFLLFVLWTFIVTLGNVFFTDDFRMLVYPMFYTFGLFFIVGIGKLSCRCSQSKLFELMQNLCLVAALVALGAYFFTLSPGYLLSFRRHSGSFNNPNQMAYFGLLIVCLSGISAWAGNRWNGKALVAVAASSLIALFSYSLSAVIAIVISLTGIIYQVLLSSQVKLSIKYSLITILLFFYLGLPVALASNNSKVNAVIHNWSIRSERADAKTENIMQERAYQRIIDYPNYLLLGAGEGGRDRFESVWRGKNQEIHSNFGTILFSYGVVGFFLFCLYFKRTMTGAPVGIWIIVMGPMVYGITHQGLRQPLFWLLFLVVSMATSKMRSDLYVPVKAGKAMENAYSDQLL